MKKELFKNTFIIAIGKFSTQIISILLLPLYTSILTPSEFGTYDFLVTLAVFLVPLISLLMEESMFRFLIDENTKEGKNKIISHCVIFSIVSSIIWALIVGIIMTLINDNNNIIFPIYLIACIIMSLANAITRGMGKIKLFSLSNFICSVLTLVLNILFIAIIKIGVLGLLLAVILANLITSIFIILKLKIYTYIDFKVIDKKTMKELIVYSIPLVPNNISWAIINISDRLIITSVMGASANGIYAISNRFPNMVNTVYGFFHTAWKESASKALKDKMMEEYYNNIYDTVKKFLYAVTICLIAIMPIAFPILINTDYNEAYQYIPILAVATYYGNLSGFYGGIFVAFKNTKVIGISTVWGAIINIIINIALIKYIGIYAAVISTLISNYAVYLYRKIKIKQYINLKENSNKTYPILILALIIAAYYNNTLIINILSLTLAIIYSLYCNKDTLKVLLKRK